MNRARTENLALWRVERAGLKIRMASLPQEIQIEATNRCRRSCPTCARNYYPAADNPPGDLSEEILDAIAPLFNAAERVLVGGCGEPLLAPVTFKILARAREAGCQSSIITGGGELDQENIHRLAAVDLSEIVMSIDSADERRQLLRRGVSLNDLMTRLEHLKIESPKLTTTFNVTLNKGNLEDLPALIQLAAKHQAAVRVVHQKIYSTRQRFDSVLAAPEKASMVFRRAQAAAQVAGVDLQLPPLGGHGVCEQPYRLMAIRRDGLVQGCCSAMFEGPAPRIVLGRLPVDNPVELWNAPAILAARAYLAGLSDEDVPCRACAFRVFTPETHYRFLDTATDE